MWYWYYCHFLDFYCRCCWAAAAGLLPGSGSDITVGGVGEAESLGLDDVDALFRPLTLPFHVWWWAEGGEFANAHFQRSVFVRGGFSEGAASAGFYAAGRQSPGFRVSSTVPDWRRSDGLEFDFLELGISAFSNNSWSISRAVDVFQPSGKMLEKLRNP